MEASLKEVDHIKQQTMRQVSRRLVRPSNMHNPTDTIKALQEENIKNGDYVYSLGMQGIYVNGGVVWDPYEWWDPNKE